MVAGIAANGINVETKEEFMDYEMASESRVSKESPIMRELNALEKVFAEQAEMVACLEARLVPVLAGQDVPRENRGDVKGPAALCPLMEELNRVGRIAARQNEKLRDIVSRLAL